MYHHAVLSHVFCGDENEEEPPNPLVVTSEDSVSEMQSQASTQAQPACIIEAPPPARAPPLVYCAQNPRRIDSKSKTPALRHIDIEIAPTLNDNDWIQIRRLGITPREFRHHEQTTWVVEPFNLNVKTVDGYSHKQIRRLVRDNV